MDQLRKQFCSLLRCQDGRRCIQNQNVDAAQKDLQNLDPLLEAYRQICDLCLRVNRQVVFFGHFLHHPDRFPQTKNAAALWFHSKHHVLRDRQRRN